MPVSGILETALSVGDLAASAAFYKRLFGFATLLDTERLVALSVAGRDVLLLFKKGATEEPAILPGVFEGGDCSLVLDESSGANAVVFATQDSRSPCFLGTGREGRIAWLVVDCR